MTADILTPGHILCIEQLADEYDVVIGLLTDEALEGYKEPCFLFKDRLFILEYIIDRFDNVEIFPQDSLDPTVNILKTECTAIASGDGFEAEERLTIENLGLREINIKLPNEKKKLWSSSKIKNECNKPKK